MKITAAVTESRGAPFELQELTLGDLRHDEVRVRIAAAGICHTDLICRDQWLPVPLPAILGHEGAGVIEAVGASVTKVAAGDRVGLTFNSCGSCRTCQTGKPSYCHQFFEYNFLASRPVDGSSAVSRAGEPVNAHFFGQSSFATYSVASERNVVKLPDDIDINVAAPFGCGIQTGAGAVLASLAVPAGSCLVVFGTGTVGLSAVLGGVIAGCTSIIGVDVNATRLELALELGATHVINADERDVLADVRALTGGGADFCVETTGVPTVLRTAVDATTPRGVTGVIGAPPFGTDVSLDVNTILSGGRVVRGIVEGDSVPDIFLPQLMTLHRQGRFPVEALMTFYDFDQIEQAAQDAGAGRTIKPVLRMS